MRGEVWIKLLILRGAIFPGQRFVQSRALFFFTHSVAHHVAIDTAAADAGLG